MPVFALDNARQQTDSVGQQTEAVLGTTPDGYRPLAQADFDGFALWCVQTDDPQGWSNIEGFVGRLLTGPNRLVKERLVFSSTGGWISWGEGTKVVISTPLSEAFNGEPWLEIAAAPTCEIWKAASRRVRVTGSAAIASFGTAPAECQALVEFAEALSLTHDPAALVLPGGADLTVAAGDRALAMYRGGAVSEVIRHLPAGAARKHSLLIPATAIMPSPQAGCGPLANDNQAAGAPTQFYLPFDAAADEHAQLSVPTPKAWTAGAGVEVSLHWADGGADAGDVVWGVRAASGGDGDAPAAWGTAATVAGTAGGIAGTQRWTGRVAVAPGGGPVAQDMLHLQVYRAAGDAGDTNTDDARLLALDVTFVLAIAGDA